MNISIHSLLEGARQATGTVAVIDVFRAFTTAAVALANGASSIVMVRTVEEALTFRDAGIGQICMGVGPRPSLAASAARLSALRRSTRWFRLRQLTVRSLGRRFQRPDDHPTDQCRHAGHC